MAAKKIIAAEIKIESKQAEQSVASIKTRLKEAKEELIQSIEQFGEFSREATVAAMKVEGLKGTMDDASRLVQAFDGDRKFHAFGTAVSAVSQGFVAAQGAMALFGSESKEVNEALLKVQSAMALSQGLNGILEGVKNFKDLRAVIMSSAVAQGAYNTATVAAAAIQKAFTGAVATTTVGFKLLRTAIIATGIGALIVGITYLITKIQEWTSSTDDQIDSQEALKNATDDLNSALNEQYGNIERLTRIEAQRARIAGKSDEEIAAIEARATKRKIATIDFFIEQAKRYGVATDTLDRERIALTKQLEDEELQRRVDSSNKLRGIQKEAAAKREAELRKEMQLREQALALEQQLYRQLRDMVSTEEEKALNQAKDNLEENLANLKKFHLDSQIAWSIYFGELRRIQQEHHAVQKMNTQIQQTDQVLMNETTLAAIKQFQDNYHNGVTIQTMDRRRMTQEEWEERKGMVNEIGNTTQGLMNILGEQTAAGKALGIATATMNTYIGATEVLRAKSVLPEPMGTISKVVNMAAIIASGIKAVKAIAKVNVPGRGGSGGSAPTAITPQLPVTATTQIGQDQANNQGNASGRTFVLESDVSGNQERIRMLNRAARINTVLWFAMSYALMNL